MIDIQEITRKIIEEKENIVAKAFTVQIGELLKENGIVPAMTEYTKQDIDNITDASEYKLVTEFGVAFKELDTSKHDAKVRSEVIDECIAILIDDSCVKTCPYEIPNCTKCMKKRLEALKEKK